MQRPHPIRIQLAPGYRETSPEAIPGKWLLWERDGKLWQAGTGLDSPKGLGVAGGTDCPIAVDSKAGAAYAYVCGTQPGSRDFSEIRRFDLTSGQISRVARLGLNQWVLWLLASLEDHAALITLLASDARLTALEIRHHLAFFDTLGARKPRALPLGRDAFCPQALCPRRGEVIFHGAEGWQRVRFAGQTLGRQPQVGEGLGRGASFHPTRPLVALGAGGLFLWDLESGALRQVRDRGHYPVWDGDGRGLWFRESSSDLVHLDLDSGVETRLLRIVGNPYPELHYARQVVPSADGRFLALGLTRKVRLNEATDRKPGAPGQPEPVWTHAHHFCVVDLARKLVWHAPIHARNIAWFEPGS